MQLFFVNSYFNSVQNFVISEWELISYAIDTNVVLQYVTRSMFVDVCLLFVCLLCGYVYCICIEVSVL